MTAVSVFILFMSLCRASPQEELPPTIRRPGRRQEENNGSLDRSRQTERALQLLRLGTVPSVGQHPKAGCVGRAGRWNERDEIGGQGICPSKSAADGWRPAETSVPRRLARCWLLFGQPRVLASFCFLVWEKADWTLLGVLTIVPLRDGRWFAGPEAGDA